jgi:hypothetical protein
MASGWGAPVSRILREIKAKEGAEGRVKQAAALFLLWFEKAGRENGGASWHATS